MKEKFNEYIKKIFIIVAILCMIFAVVFVIKLYYDTKERQAQIEKSLVEMKQLGDNIIRNQSKYATKEDLENFGKDLNLKEIKADLESLDAKLIGISKIVAISLAYHGTNLPSDHVIPNPNPNNGTITVICPEGTEVECPDIDKYGYFKNAQVKDLYEMFNGTKVPFGSTTFKAWEKNPWDVTINERKYRVATILGEDEDGRHYVYNKFDIEVDGKTYSIPIQKGEFLEQYPEASILFNPKIFLGVIGGAAIRTTAPLVEDDPWVYGSLIPNLAFSPFSYGVTKTRTQFVFPKIGVGYDAIAQAINFSLAPISYNLGSAFDSNIISNLYIEPSVGVDINSDGDALITLGGGVAVSF